MYDNINYCKSLSSSRQYEAVGHRTQTQPVHFLQTRKSFINIKIFYKIQCWIIPLPSIYVKRLYDEVKENT